jgi:molybdopterin synthase sulfur carrier subunit
LQVSFYASLRQVAGQKMIEIPISNGVTVRELVSEIIERIPSLERELIDDHGELYEHIHVVVNGRDVRYLEGGLDRELLPDDQVSVFPAVSGGSIKV